ncbi:MAG: lipoprotein signal peptidase [Chitinophagales bacterium]|nr:lipoprotein signal peptidase [Chitinophagales bacterium]
MKNITWKLTFLVILILILDQSLKFWVKLNFTYGGGFDILGLSWAKIQFVENEGMAFGWLLGGETGKLLLTSFRLMAIPVGIYYLHYLIKRKYHTGFIFCIALIFAGALGNLIDSVFYGEIFSHSYGQIATLFPPEGGYGKWMHGKVVDMFYFPFFEITFPQNLPLIGGESFSFFQYIFNVADSSISIGVVTILIFQKKFFSTNK